MAQRKSKGRGGFLTSFGLRIKNWRQFGSVWWHITSLCAVTWLLTHFGIDISITPTIFSWSLRLWTRLRGFWWMNPSNKTAAFNTRVTLFSNRALKDKIILLKWVVVTTRGQNFQNTVAESPDCTFCMMERAPSWGRRKYLLPTAACVSPVYRPMVNTQGSRTVL